MLRGVERPSSSCLRSWERTSPAGSERMDLLSATRFFMRTQKTVESEHFSGWLRSCRIDRHEMTRGRLIRDGLAAQHDFVMGYRRDFGRIGHGIGGTVAVGGGVEIRVVRRVGRLRRFLCHRWVPQKESLRNENLNIPNFSNTAPTTAAIPSMQRKR